MRSKVIHVVAGVIAKDRLVLACQRARTAEFPLKWEFPGGKVEHGEHAEAALRRELREELDIEAEELTEIFQHVHRYSQGPVVYLKFFRVERYRGDLKNRLFEEIRWVKPEQLTELDFLEADAVLIQRLARPDSNRLLFTV